MNSKTSKSSIVLHIVTPLIILALAAAILLVGMIEPYNKAKVYINLAFMDDLKTKPADGTAGLVITENEIDLDYNGETSNEGEVVRPKFGEQFAALSCDKFEFTVPVYWGSNRELFERGACQASSSILPGDFGNTVISAHEDTYFADLYKLEVGDTVTVNTAYGEFVYTVTETISFKKTNKKYVIPTEDTRLTLYTCKKNILGASDERVGVVCELTEKKFYVTDKEAEDNE